jgi:hypothetical protein
MELLRLNNTTSLSASFTGLTASSNYNLELDDLILLLFRVTAARNMIRDGRAD